MDGQPTDGRGGPAQPGGGRQAPGPCEALLALLANVVARLDAAEDEALLGLTRQSDARRVAELAAAVARLATTEDERRRAGEALLGLLAVQNDSSMAAELAAAVARLDPVGMTGAGPVRRCSGYWSARPAPGWPQSWRSPCAAGHHGG